MAGVSRAAKGIQTAAAVVTVQDAAGKVTIFLVLAEVVPPRLAKLVQTGAIPLDKGCRAELLAALAPYPAIRADVAARLVALERISSYDTRPRAGLPPLSDQDISRESIYEGRGQ